MNLKSSRPCRALLLLLTAFGIQQARLAFSQASTWQTVDIYRAEAPVPGARPSDIGTDASRSILYAVGSAIIPDGSHPATIRASHDSGASWNTLDMFLDPNYSWAHYTGLSSAPNGDLLTCGTLSVPTSGTGWRWVVRRSRDQGFTWTTVDSPFLGQGNPRPRDVKVAPSGEVYVVGRQVGATVPYQWVVRKSSQAGDPNTWATVDVLGTTGSSSATYITFSGGSVFVVGQVATTSGVGAWTVRRQNADGLWSTVDSYQETSGQPSGAESITVNGNNIYVAGFAKGLVYLNGKKGKGTYIDYWVVRRSTDGGTTWTTVDKYKSPDGTFLTPNSLTTDSSGNIWVCGYTGSLSSSSQWLVRKGTPGADGTISWINSELFKIGTGAAANGITVDFQGHIYVTGNWVDEVDGENWWLTRKLAVP